MKFIAGMIVGILLLGALGFAAIYLGLINMAATRKPMAIEEEIGEMAFENSMRKRAAQVNNPHKDDPGAREEGLDHYMENCLVCHGAPGVDKGEIGKGLNPPAPELEESVEEFTDAELFWTVKNGIRMTGMPAFAPTHSDEELWNVVTFMRHLPELSAAERERLIAFTEREEAHHHDEVPAAQTQTQGQPKSKPHTHEHGEHPHDDD